MDAYTTELTVNGELQWQCKLTPAQIIRLQNAIADIANDEY